MSSLAQEESRSISENCTWGQRKRFADGEVTAFSEKLWCGLLDYATAYADGRLTFTFKNGSTFES